MVKVGIIGCGFMGEMHASCYKQIKDVEIVALADVRTERTDKVKIGTNAVIFNDGKDLINSAKVDLIDICLPTYLHAQYAEMAMEKVNYVMVEKPLALTIEEGKSLLKKAEKTKCRVQVGQSMRFSDQYNIIKNIVESKKDSQIISADFYRISSRPTWGYENWLLDSKLSGGAAQDLHVHDIDFILYLFGRPKHFNTIKNICGEKNCFIDTIMSYENFVVNVMGTWNMPASYPFAEGCRIQFIDSAIEYKDGKVILYDASGEKELKVEKKELGIYELNPTM